MGYTIVAQATASGLSGLAIIRVSGDEAFIIANKCFEGNKKIIDAKSHTILYGDFIYNGVIIDKVTCSIFHKPNSYTGENTIEFGTHGGAIIPNQIINALIDAGCKYAEPGEFTRRAFINGKIDLVQAEAVADIIHSISVPSATISAKQLQGGMTNMLDKLRNNLVSIAAMIELEMDFAEENIILSSEKDILENIETSIKTCSDLIKSYHTANILRDGFVVAIIGKPNAGKSTLFNSFLNTQRAIVSSIAGTTRDFISEIIYINDIPIKVIDTAGLRDSDNIIEMEGIQYTHKMLQQANLILFINDISNDENNYELLHQISSKYPATKIILVNNKIDLVENKTTKHTPNSIETINISANIQDKNFIKLKNKIASISKEQLKINNDILLNERQYFKLVETINSLNTAKELLLQSTISEILSIEIRNAGKLLGELTGQSWSEEVLNNIFARFCIGK
ncbi:MAG: tRNA uridine-5-carboxymethylaminomethyl(34) synthesis GTPase MnmE [Bacteroidetes bacterium]|nr:tRNA uridine-5-carboxymethylaminomethyl(34) synthesis GTPase MnmE [Bacteroidota bacterium]